MKKFFTLAVALLAAVAAPIAAAAQVVRSTVATAAHHAHDTLVGYMANSGLLLTMAQVAVKSAAITNANANPSVLNQTGLANGQVVRAVNGLVTLTSGDTQAATLAAGASTYRVGKVRSSDFYDQLRIVTTADMGTTTVVDVGLYDVLKHPNGGAVVDQDFFASSLSFKDGALVTTGSGVNAADQTFEAGAAGGLITNAEKRIWECLGLSADPCKEYDVVLTLTGACDGTGTALVQVYVVR